MEIEIFSSGDCHYCALARKLLDDQGLPYTERRIDTDEADRQTLMHRLPGVKNLPQIFIGGEHIGSYEDLLALARNGELNLST